MLISCVERKESGIKITPAHIVSKEFVPSQEKSGYHYGYSVMKGKYCYHYGSYTESEQYNITLGYSIGGEQKELQYDNSDLYKNLDSSDKILILYREIYLDSVFDHYQLECMIVNNLKINI